MLVLSISSFYHNNFYYLEERNYHLSHLSHTCFVSTYNLNLFPKKDSSKLKELADDNFELDENDRKYSKRVENTVGKGEIARYEQFLLFPQCFQKTSNADM